MRRFPIPVLCLFLLLAATSATAQEDGSDDVVDSGVEERVNVILVEFKVLVTDKQGNPITDLEAEEVVVTTRSQAEKRGEPLPEAFVPGK